MPKKTANSAIDFKRIFALKDQLAREDATGATNDAAPDALTAPGANGQPTAEASRAAPEPVLQLVPPPRAAPREEVRALELADAPADDTGMGERGGTLRIGMPRGLHEKLRALAALEGRSVTAYVRDLLEETPAIDPKVPFSELQALALAVVPLVATHARAEVRMQLPVSTELHTRLHQIAALRGQTLGACLADVLEAHAKR